jgi:hypothetical protein
LDWKHIKEIKYFLEEGVGTTIFVLDDFAAADWALPVAFFLGFTAAGLESAAALDHTVSHLNC